MPGSGANSKRDKIAISRKRRPWALAVGAVAAPRLAEAHAIANSEFQFAPAFATGILCAQVAVTRVMR